MQNKFYKRIILLYEIILKKVFVNIISFRGLLNRRQRDSRKTSNNVNFKLAVWHSMFIRRTL